MKDRLIYLALVVLEEEVQEAGRRPVKPTIGLRLALAYLYSVSDQKDRKSYDDFWQVVTGKREHKGHQPPDYIRAVSATTFLHRIRQTLGIEYTVSVAEKLRSGGRR